MSPWLWLSLVWLETFAQPSARRRKWQLEQCASKQKKQKKNGECGVSFLAPKLLLLLHVRTARAQRSDVLCQNLTVVASKVSNPHLYLKFGIAFKLDSIQSYAGCTVGHYGRFKCFFIIILVLSVDVLM